MKTTSFNSIIFLLTTLFHLNSQNSKFCGHSKFQPQTLEQLPESDVTLKPNPRSNNLEQSASHIRIHLDYFTINSFGLVNEEYITSLKQVINDVVNTFNQLLSVYDPVSQLRIDRSKILSCQYTFDSTANINGVYDADVVIIPQVLNEQQLGEGVEAAAVVCLLGAESRRPVLGALLLGAQYDFSKKNAFEYMKSVLLHEITHILVFSPSLYSYYKGYSTVTQRGYIRNRTSTFLITPKVVEAARKHFNCSTLIGVELEDQGGSGTAGAHWEARTMLGEYMIATVYGETVISEMTLALFEDSGWYKVNYYSGGLFRYGKNQGCDFLNQKCVTNGKSNFKEFCTTLDSQMCLPNHISRGFCYMDRFEYVEEQYQYFSRANVGGFYPADYCPVPYENQDQAYIQGNCKVGITYPDSGLRNEVIGDKSVCVDSSLSQSGYVNYRGTCYPIECDYDKKQFMIKVGNTSVACGLGMPVKQGVEGYNGVINCPDFSRVCTGNKLCNDMFDCISLQSTIVEGDYVGSSFNMVIYKSLYMLFILLLL